MMIHILYFLTMMCAETTDLNSNIFSHYVGVSPERGNSYPSLI